MRKYRYNIQISILWEENNVRVNKSNTYGNQTFENYSKKMIKWIFKIIIQTKTEDTRKQSIKKQDQATWEKKSKNL